MALTDAQKLARSGKLDRLCPFCGTKLVKHPGEIDYDFWRRKSCSKICGNNLSNRRRWEKPRKSLAERFSEYYITEPNSGCWLWFGATIPQGYGVIGVATDKIKKAHRVSWEIHNGPIPNGLHVLHKCDNPPCVNPDHLWLGTNADNQADKGFKKRGRNSRSKLC